MNEFQLGTLTCDLVAGGEAEMLTSSGDKITVHEWLLPVGGIIADGIKVMAAYDRESQRFYVTHWPSG